MKFEIGKGARDYILLSALWLAVNSLPFYWLASGSYFHWEVLEVRKMLDYGFWLRKGAMLDFGWYVGLTPNPESHNYVNHPYPIVWLYALLHWLFGKAGMYALVAIRSLVTVLLTYRFLTKFFSRSVSGLVTGLVIFSHAIIEFTMNTDVVGQGVIVWPVAGLIAVRMRDHPSRLAAIALGLVIFLAGQITWFALSVTPALLVLCLPRQISIRDAIRRPWLVPGWLPLMVGAVVSFGLFLAQVLAYSPKLQGNAQYLGLQMGVGAGGGPSRFSMVPVMLLRMVLASPALWFGAALGGIVASKSATDSRPVNFVLLYFGVFAGIMLAIPRLLYLNQHGYSYMVFPCAVMTAMALQGKGRGWFKCMLMCMALPGLFFCYAKLHDYRTSTASLTLGRWIANNTAKDELVFTNFKHLIPPLQEWDGEFSSNVSYVADRLTFRGLTTQADLLVAVGDFTEDSPRASFLREESQPLDKQLSSRLERDAKDIISATILVPPEQPRYFKRARNLMWKSLGSRAPQYAAQYEGTLTATNIFNVRLYRLPPDFVRSLRGSNLNGDSPPANARSDASAGEKASRSTNPATAQP